jgi:hypothetical protein
MSAALTKKENVILRGKVAELEAALAERDAELEKLRDAFRRTGFLDGVENATVDALNDSDENKLLLPLEVIAIIGSFLPSGALSRLSSTSKAVRQILEPSMYSLYIPVDIWSQTVPSWAAVSPDRLRWITSLYTRDSVGLSKMRAVSTRASENLRHCGLSSEHELEILAKFRLPKWVSLNVPCHGDDNQDSGPKELPSALANVSTLTISTTDVRWRFITRLLSLCPELTELRVSVGPRIPRQPNNQDNVNAHVPGDYSLWRLPILRHLIYAAGEYRDSFFKGIDKFSELLESADVQLSPVPVSLCLTQPSMVLSKIKNWTFDFLKSGGFEVFDALLQHPSFRPAAFEIRDLGPALDYQKLNAALSKVPRIDHVRVSFYYERGAESMAWVPIPLTLQPCNSISRSSTLGQRNPCSLTPLHPFREGSLSTCTCLVKPRSRMS